MAKDVFNQSETILVYDIVSYGTILGSIGTIDTARAYFDQNIGLHEVFLESVPTTIIITCIYVKSSKN